MEQWVQSILENRADKSWSPRLFGGEDVVTEFPVLYGITVELDETLHNRTLQIRCAEDVTSMLREDRPVEYQAGDIMAEFTGVPITPTEDKENASSRDAAGDAASATPGGPASTGPASSTRH